MDPSAITMNFLDYLTLLDQEFEKIRSDPLEVEYSDIQFNEKLGEGAFGIVHRGVVRAKRGSKHEVAIKSLKGTKKTHC